MICYCFGVYTVDMWYQGFTTLNYTAKITLGGLEKVWQIFYKQEFLLGKAEKNTCFTFAKTSAQKFKFNLIFGMMPGQS